MVRSIDAASRRELLVATVWRLIEAHGLDAASVRGVAAEAGLSTGSVRHFFGSQTELHVFAMEALSDRVRARIAVAAEVSDPEVRGFAMLAELLPVTERTRMEFGAWLQFVARAAVDPRLAVVADRHLTEIRACVSHVVELRIAAGLVAADTDRDAEAAELGAVLDGLTVEVLLAPRVVSPERAMGVLRRRLRVDGRVPAS